MANNNAHIALYQWHDTIERDLPWKEDNNPYKIWVSEIILQQTRVEQGRPYYIRFIDAFPDISTLANAPLDSVLRLWQGLGYYSRARNMHVAAQQILERHNGVFPANYKDIIALKGIGTYTAAAIASFAYHLPYAVMDGNVKRVVSRIFSIEDPINTSKGEKRIMTSLDELFDAKTPDRFNQAIMDLGATVCTPKNPSCGDCPWQSRCKAYHESTIELLPVKKRNQKKKDRFFIYILMLDKDRIFLRQRPTDSIWKGLYEIPYIEVEKKVFDSPSEMLSQSSLKDYMLYDFSLKHILSHQNIYARLANVNFSSFDPPIDGFWCGMKDLDRYAMPRLVEKILAKAEIIVQKVQE